MPVKLSDLHVHLYGTLTPEDLWRLGRDRLTSHARRLDWYAAEFAKVTGREPIWKDYWAKDSGLELLRADFLIQSAVSFPRFQASFNAIIALCPLTPGDASVLRLALERDRHLHLHHIEYRLKFPGEFDNAAVDQYLTLHAEHILAARSQDFYPSIAWSLPRDNGLLARDYARLKAWQASHPKLRGAFTGIDFCFFEEGHPPADKRTFFADVHRDNRERPDDALAILYHVGEQFHFLSPLSALRWIMEAAQYGAHRLGHAMALGLQCKHFPKRDDVPAEAARHRAWLQEYATELRALGYVARDVDVHSAEYEEECARLARTVARYLRERDVPVEVCPSSNFRIGGIAHWHEHPVQFFARAEVPFVVATDDPGIFATDLLTERSLISAQNIPIIDATRYFSTHLVAR